MSKPGEHKTVQARILAYAHEIGWSFVSREEAEQRRGVGIVNGEERMVKGGSLFFDDLLDAKVREFNPRYAEAEGALLGQFPPSPRLRRTGRHLHTAIYGNPPSPERYGGTSRDFVEHLRNPPSQKGYGGTGRGKFFDHEEKRERDLILISRN